MREGDSSETHRTADRGSRRAGDSRASATFNQLEGLRPLTYMHTVPTQLETDTQNFFIFWKDKPNNVGSFPRECVNVIHSYFEDILHIPRFIGNASQYLNGVPGFTLIRPDGTNKPGFGDLVVFDYKPDGHIGILNWTSAGFINCFEQNFPLNSVCHFQTHDYAHIAGWLHWNGVIRDSRITDHIADSSKMVLNYTVYNGSADLMQQAHQLLLAYGKGRFDATFDFRTAPQQKSGVFTTDEQVIFLHNTPTSPFVFFFYESGIPNYAQIATAQVPQTNVIMSCATPAVQSPLNLVYEMCNALSLYLNKPLPPDSYTPDSAFVQKRFDLLT